MYTVGGRQKGDNKLYTFTSRPVHLLATSYLLLSSIHVRSALQAGVRLERRERKECPGVSFKKMHERPRRGPEALHMCPTLNLQLRTVGCGELRLRETSMNPPGRIA